MPCRSIDFPRLRSQKESVGFKHTWVTTDSLLPCVGSANEANRRRKSTGGLHPGFELTNGEVEIASKEYSLFRASGHNIMYSDIRELG